MFDELQARCAMTVREAEASLLDFIAEGAERDAPHHVQERSRGFDLYLPWFWEVVESQRAHPDRDHLDFLQLDRLYMDAAWSLVARGILRPGPRTIEGDAGTNTYGKGFSLMVGELAASGIGRERTC